MWSVKNIRDDTQEMPQSPSTIPGYQQKDRWGTNKVKANTTYDITETQTNNNFYRDTALEWSVGNYSVVRGKANKNIYNKIC